jgi:hypothetical protein
MAPVSLKQIYEIDELRHISFTLEQYARWGIGQFSDVFHEYEVWRGKKPVYDKISKCRLILDQMKQKEFGIPSGGYNGIGNRDNSKLSDVAWECYTVIRYFISWRTYWKEHPEHAGEFVREGDMFWSVCYDEPMKISKTPFIHVNEA